MTGSTIQGMTLLELPDDIILQVFRWCDVKTILCMQRTCHRMDSLSRARFSWNIKALETSSETTPSIPLHLNLSALSDLELRDAVVSPARSLARLLRGRIYYGRRRSVKFPPLYTTTSFSPTAFCSENVRVTGGGRLVIINSVDVLHVIDIASGVNGTCIWSRTADSVVDANGRGVYVKISSSAVDMLEDGSLNLLILFQLKGSRANFLAEVHRVFPNAQDNAKEQKPEVVQDYLSRNDDTPCLKGNYIIIPGESFLTVTDWRRRRTVEVDLPGLYSMTELLKLEVHGDHIFFLLRSFYAIERRRYNYELHAIRLSSLFDGLANSQAAEENTVFEQRNGFGDVDHASITLPHTVEHTLVSTSRMTISSPSGPMRNYLQDLGEKREFEEEVSLRITLGGKFWLSNIDSIHNFFSLYVLSFHPSCPSDASDASTISSGFAPSKAYFILEHFPTPVRHPLENSSPHHLIAYASGCPSFTVQNRGMLMHTNAYSHLRLSFFLSMIGLDEKGELKFAEVDPRFGEDSHADGEEENVEIKYKLHVPVEQYEGSLVLMSIDSRSCEIWYPI